MFCKRRCSFLKILQISQACNFIKKRLQHISLQFFLKAVFHQIYLVNSWILCLYVHSIYVLRPEDMKNICFYFTWNITENLMLAKTYMLLLEDNYAFGRFPPNWEEWSDFYDFVFTEDTISSVVWHETINFTKAKKRHKNCSCYVELLWMLKMRLLHFISFVTIIRVIPVTESASSPSWMLIRQWWDWEKFSTWVKL